MKQTITLLFFLLLVQSSFAQKIRFTDTGNAWHEGFGDMSTGGVRKYEVYGNTNINGNTYNVIVESKYKTPRASVREDTINQQVYLAKGNSEILLYDYSLNIGDTIHYPNGEHYVSSIDSTQIDSVWHKVFNFNYGASGGWNYTVVEGIGCIDGLLFPIENYSIVEAHFRLVCFHNNEKKSIINPPVPYGNPNVWQIFTNTDSCYVGISALTRSNDNQITISPHPANAGSIISLPDDIKTGSILIINTVGQVVAKQNIHNQTTIQVGSLNLNNGIYFYRISGSGNGEVWQGKLVHQ